MAGSRWCLHAGVTRSLCVIVDIENITDTGMASSGRCTVVLKDAFGQTKTKINTVYNAGKRQGFLKGYRREASEMNSIPSPESLCKNSNVSLPCPK